MDRLESFILQIPDFDKAAKSELIDYFSYFLLTIEGQDVVTPADVNKCFELLRIEPYSNIPSYMSAKSKRGAGKRYIKKSGGYLLERSRQLGIQKKLHVGPAKQETSHLLRNLLNNVTDARQRAFLQEAIDCYEIGARRAAIIMAWILTMNHLQRYVLYHKLKEFNVALSTNKDRRVKVTSVSRIDDFSEIPEGKFIEFCRAGAIITADVRRILDQKLGTRNSAAHPSGISLSEVKSTDFIIDLVENVIEKYKV